MGNLNQETRFGVQALIHFICLTGLTAGAFRLQATPITAAGLLKFSTQTHLQAQQRPTQALQLTTTQEAARINTHGLKASFREGRLGELQ